MNQYFIVGTDTDCGKTYVTAQLVDGLKQHHQRVLAIKPVASGCVQRDGLLVSEDAAQLDAHHGIHLDDALFWRFKSPISPHLAAAEEGVALSAASIGNTCASFNSDDLDCLLIEGAGGLMAPLNAQETWVDFLIQTRIPVILVVGMRLGCINHALLTEAVLNMNRIDCVGWVANCLDPMMMALQENIDTLSDKLSFPHITTISFGGVIRAADIAEYLNVHQLAIDDVQEPHAIPD